MGTQAILGRADGYDLMCLSRSVGHTMYVVVSPASTEGGRENGVNDA